MAAFRAISRETISETALKFVTLNGPSACCEAGLDLVAFRGRRGADRRADGAFELAEADDEAAAGGLLDARLVMADVCERVAQRSWVMLGSSKATVMVAPLLNSMPALRAGGTASEMRPGTRIAAEIRK